MIAAQRRSAALDEKRATETSLRTFTAVPAAALAPFVLPPPGSPVEESTLWAVLAWVRRQFDRSTLAVVDQATNTAADTVVSASRGDPLDVAGYPYSATNGVTIVDRSIATVVDVVPHARAVDAIQSGAARPTADPPLTNPLASWSMSGGPVPRRRATLASLAAELKVSRTTISNAYNRPDQLSADLRERVLATAKLLGYAGPDPVARSLRTRRAGAIGLILTEPLNYSFRDPAALDFVAGLAESCEQAGQGLLLVAAGPNRSVSDGTAAVLSAGVDGFIVYSASDDDPYLQVIAQRALPIVVVDQPEDVPGASRVCIDDRAAMRGIAEYVIGLGHQDIGVLTMRLGREWPHGGATSAVADLERTDTPHFHVQRERICGVQDAMKDAGLQPGSLTVVESCDHLPTSGGRAAAVALEVHPRITALLCTADVLALSAMDYLRAHGIYVPGQVTVTGFDGVPDALARGLTTVKQPSVEKGRRAGYLLHTPRTGLPVVEVLETELVRGRTSGPAG